MSQIVPALLCQSRDEFERQLRLVEHECKLIQVDALDDTLFPNSNWFDAQEIGKMKTTVEMELHLMMENPIPIVEQWKEHVPTFVRAIVHAETHRPNGAVLNHLKDVVGIEVGMAINPETPLREIENVIHQIDVLTIMSVHPGFQGQAFGDEEHVHDKQMIFDKIKQARNHQPDLAIEIDGGVTDELIDQLVQAGVDLIGVGSLIFKDQDPRRKLKELNERL